MKIKSSTICIVFCLLSVLLVLGCAGTPTRESTGQYVDDSVITTKVKAELTADKVVSIFQIGVETYKGVVQLSGFVNTKEQSAQAEAVAKKVGGVREVKNSLIVKPQ
jgi:osmotically-inducible protein OsmY